jgi:hypothetical protein
MPQIAGFRGTVAGGERDPGRAVYRYHQVFAGPGGRQLVRKMLVCAVRLTPWQDGEIRPHETVDAAARDGELARIRETRSHAQPVLAGFRDAAGETDRLFRKAESAPPTVEKATPDGTAHRLWRVQDAELLGKLRHLFAPKPLHVLEGHARYEAMLAYKDELAARQTLALYSSASYGLGCLVEVTDPALVVAARHRVVRGTSAKSGPALAGANEHFLVEKLAGAAGDVGRQLGALAEVHAHQPAFIAVFAGEPDAWKLTLKPEVSPIAAGVTAHRAPPAGRAGRDRDRRRGRARRQGRRHAAVAAGRARRAAAHLRRRPPAAGGLDRVPPGACAKPHRDDDRSRRGPGLEPADFDRLVGIA